MTILDFVFPGHSGLLYPYRTGTEDEDVTASDGNDNSTAGATLTWEWDAVDVTVLPDCPRYIQIQLEGMRRQIRVAAMPPGDACLDER